MTDHFGLILVAVLLIILLTLYRFHSGPRSFDLTDLLMENGRVSKIAVAFMLTLVVTTWMMAYMTLNKMMTEGFLIAYMSAWVAPIVARIVKGTPESDKSDVPT